MTTLRIGQIGCPHYSRFGIDCFHGNVSKIMQCAGLEVSVIDRVVLSTIFECEGLTHLSISQGGSKTEQRCHIASLIPFDSIRFDSKFSLFCAMDKIVKPNPSTRLLSKYGQNIFPLVAAVIPAASICALKTSLVMVSKRRKKQATNNASKNS